MGQTLKVSAHLHVEGQCGGVDRLTLCYPRRKGGRRLLASFTFPSAGDGAGHHLCAKRSKVSLAKMRRKDGATPVRVDFLAGESLVARREIPLADLLAALKANTTGRRSGLFFALDAEQAQVEGNTPDAHGPHKIAVFHSRRRLFDTSEDPANSHTDTSKCQEAGTSKTSLLDKAGTSKTSLCQEAGTSLADQITQHYLEDGHKFTLPLISYQENTARQAAETVATLMPEVTHRDLMRNQRCISMPELRNRRENLQVASSGEEEGHIVSQSSTASSPEIRHSREEPLVAPFGEEAERIVSQSSTMSSPEVRHRIEEPQGAPSGEEEERFVSQASTASPTEQGKKLPRTDRRGVCVSSLVDSMLQIAQFMTFTLVMFQVSLEWF